MACLENGRGRCFVNSDSAGLWCIRLIRNNLKAVQNEL